MKISELLGENWLWEDQSNKPAAIIETERFAKDRREFLDNNLTRKLDNWLEKKRLNPLQLLGRLDRVGSYNLVPWNHWHLRFGNTILIHYMALPELIILAAISDHRAVDGGTAELDSMAAYLKSIDVDSFKAKVQELASARTTVTASPLTKEQIQQATDLLYELATDPAEKNLLKQAVASHSIEPIQHWFVVLHLPQDSSSISKYLEIASQALKHVN